MIRKTKFFRVVGAVLAFWLMPPGTAFSVHYLGHVEGGGLSQQEVDAFCKQYPALIKSPNLNELDRPKYEKLYQQHCDQPVAKPGKPPTPAQEPDKPGKQPQIRRSRIDRIQPPACLAQGSEIHVRGEELRNGQLNCHLEGGGERRPLQAYSRTAREYRFRLDHLQPGPDYVLQCEVDGDRARIALRSCDEPGAPAQAGDVDLAAEIRAGALRPGETQMVEVLIPNRGQSRTPRNERYRVRLVLVDRDLTREGGMAIGGRGTLLEKEQWALRVPAGGQSERLSMAMNVPGKLAGSSGLHWCALADSAGAIPESNKRNNLACIPASDGDGTVERTDLAGVFGRKARPALQERQILPENLVLPSGDTPESPGCTDPAVPRLVVEIVRGYDGVDNRVNTYINFNESVRNIGSVDFVSGEGQQHVDLLELAADSDTPQLLGGWASFRFDRLDAGEYLGPHNGFYGSTRNWFEIGDADGTGAATKGMGIRLVYDPDIFTDGNPHNDDCNLDNNELFVSGEQLRGWAESGRRFVEYHADGSTVFRAREGIQASVGEIGLLPDAVGIARRHLHVDESPLWETLLPAADGAVPATLLMTLWVNGEPGIMPVAVDRDGPLELSWRNLPADVGGLPVTHLNLRASGSPFADGDCSGGPSSWPEEIGFVEGGHYGATELPEGGTGNIDLSQPAFASSRPLYFKACIGVDNDGADYVEETNMVQVNFGDFIEAVTELNFSAEAPEIEATSWPGFGWAEMEIIDMLRIRGGADRGKIAILVSAQKSHPELPAPRMEPFTAQIRKGSEVVWQGTGRIRNILFGLGDYIVTDYTPFSPVMLEAVINPPGIEPEYDDHSGRGNSLKKHFNWEAVRSESESVEELEPESDYIFEEGSRDQSISRVRRLRSGDGWSAIGVTYDLSQWWLDSAEYCDLNAFAIEPDADIHRFGEAERQPIHCRGGGGIRASAGRNQYRELYCVLDQDTAGEAPFSAVEVAELACSHRLLGGSTAPPHKVRGRVADARQWTPLAEQGPWPGPVVEDEPDLFIPYAGIEYSDGRPGALRLNVSNARDLGTGLLNRVPVEIALVKAGGVVKTLRYELSSIGHPGDPGRGTVRLSLNEPGWSWAPVEDSRLHASWIKIVVNPDGRILESDRRNNEYRVNVIDYYPRL